MLREASDYIRGELVKKGVFETNYAIICGTGLDGIADKFERVVEIEYGLIPGFLKCTVNVSKNKLVCIKINSQFVLIFMGRFHFYEGYTPQQIGDCIKILKILNVKTLVVTNVSGALNAHYNVGDVVCIEDQICLPSMAGMNPFMGRNDEEYGPRFPSMIDIYDTKLMQISTNALQQLKIPHHSGIYTMIAGPAIETIAEAKFLKAMGGDIVGMSTCYEVMAAQHCSIKTLGLSLITDIVSYNKNDKKVTIQVVLENLKKHASRMQDAIYYIMNDITIHHYDNLN